MSPYGSIRSRPTLPHPNTHAVESALFQQQSFQQQSSQDTRRRDTRRRDTRFAQKQKSVGQFFRLLDRASPGLATRLAELMFLMPPRSSPIESSRMKHGRFKLGSGRADNRGSDGEPSRERLEAKRFTFVSDGRRLQAYAWGRRAELGISLDCSKPDQSPTVLLIHGWGGHGRQFEGLVEQLVDAGFAVVSLDLPAHGSSPGRTTNAFEMRRAVIDLVGSGFTEVAHAGVGPLHAVIAHSFGAMVTALALNEGLLANVCVFVAPMTSFGYAVSAFSAALGLSPQLGERMMARLETRYGISGAGMEVAETAGSRTVPLLVVHDTEDTRVPFDLGRTLVEAWPGAKLHATTGLGHQRVLADAAVIERLVRFVRATLGSHDPV
jgi:pimeloyl-ACP methyl ester carboxylesterase